MAKEMTKDIVQEAAKTGLFAAAGKNSRTNSFFPGLHSAVYLSVRLFGLPYSGKLL